MLASPGAGGADPGAPAVLPAARFHRITTAQGLSDTRVRSILQDRTGFLWMGTGEALTRYDGRRFRTFRHDSRDPRSIAPGVAFALHEDREGSLWVGLIGGGLCRFDPETETFRTYRHDPADPNSLSDDNVADIAEGRGGDLWIATSRGLNRFEPKRETFTRFRHDPRDPATIGDDEVTSLAPDPKGHLWVGTAGGGLNRLSIDGRRARFEHWRHDPRDARSLGSNNVESVLLDRKGRLWVGTWGAGLQRFDPGRQSFVRGTKAAWTRADERIQDLLEDTQGAIWVATWGSGVVRIDPATSVPTRHEPDPSDPTRLSHANVDALFEDRRGLLWIGTHGGGLNSLDLMGQPFETLAPVGERVRDVRAVLEDREGGLWAGTAGGGLLRLDRSGRVTRRYRHAAADPGSLRDDNIMALHEDRDGELWVGTLGGLDRLDRARGRFVHYRHDPARSDSLSHDLVTSLFGDGSGRLWVGTRSGLNLLDRARGRFRRYARAPGGASQPLVDGVLGIADDIRGVLFVLLPGTLARLDPESGVLVPVPLLADGEEDKTISWCIERAPSGALWVCKGSSLFERKALAEAGQWTRRGVPDGGDGVIAAIAGDAAGQLWLSTTRGLVRYDPARDRARRYSAEDGVLDEGFNPRAVFHGSQGAIYFGSASGIAVVRPADVHVDTAPPPVAFTGLRLSHRPLTPGEPLLPRGLSEATELRLPHDERVLTAEFAALSFRAPRQNRFRYRLLGFDTAWHDLPPDRAEVTYTNLSPGRYRLQVSAANSDGAWNEAGASLRLRVLPPWWGTWWFRLAVIGALAIALVAAHRARTWAVRARNRVLELELSTEQALRQQQDRLAHASRVLTLGELAAAIAHELNQPLTAILSNAEAARMLHARPEPSHADVEMALRDISRDAARGGEIIRKLRDLVRRGESKQDVLDVNTTIRSVEPFLRAAGLADEVELELELARVLPEALGDAIQIQQVVLNLARNAVEAMRPLPPAERRLRIRTSREARAVVVEVVDNGPALEEQALAGLFVPFVSTKREGLGMGLSISRSIVESHGGEIGAQRNEGRGLTMRFTLPLADSKLDGIGA